MLVKKDTKIIVACPFGLVTGGSETLHQLVDILNQKKYNAYIFYANSPKGKRVSVPEKFKKYNIKTVSTIEDSNKNILIVPEANTEILYKYKDIRKCIWWLSVDFYFRSFPLEKAKYSKKFNNINRKSFAGRVLYLLLVIQKIFKFKKFRMFKFNKDKYKNEYYHLYNCEYAREFLLSNGINEERMGYLCGPISEEYFEYDENINKYNIVAYNPKKGSEYSSEIIKTMNKIDKNILFIPIRDMNLSQVNLLLKRAKVYMDFGYFPGPERIPREAVLSYCNIITSKFGSARNDKDVLIPERFKFDNILERKSEICEAILNLIYNYKEFSCEYDSYRVKVKEQRDMFNDNIEKYFFREDD